MVGIFPAEASATRFVGAVLADIHDEGKSPTDATSPKPRRRRSPQLILESSTRSEPVIDTEDLTEIPPQLGYVKTTAGNIAVPTDHLPGCRIGLRARMVLMTSVGSIHRRSAGGASTASYVMKKSSTGNIDWVAKRRWVLHYQAPRQPGGEPNRQRGP